MPAVLVVFLLLSGCSAGFVNMEATLKSEPFATETLRGNVAEATQCVGQFWKNSVLPPGAWWKANPENQNLLASGIGIGRREMPVSLVIVFEETEGATVARAHIHRGMSSKDERKTIAADSLAACRDNSRFYYAGVKGIVLTTGEVIEGRIIGIDNDVLKIRTGDGEILSFSFMNDVKKYIMK